ARLITDRDAGDLHVQHLCVTVRRRMQVGLGFALEEVEHAAADVLRASGDTDDAIAIVRGLGPDRATRARTVYNTMLDTAQWHHRAWLEWRGLRQPAQACSDPRAMALG